MTIQPINSFSLALFVSPDDLMERGLKCEDLSAEHTLALAREAFRQAGLPLSEPLELESWPDKCGLLVFIHLPRPNHTVWSFENGEDLLLAAAALQTELPENTLYWWKDRFWLILEGDHPPLAEFGDQQEGDLCLPVRLREYGTALIHSNALAQLHTYI